MGISDKNIFIFDNIAENGSYLHQILSEKGYNLKHIYFDDNFNYEGISGSPDLILCRMTESSYNTGKCEVVGNLNKKFNVPVVILTSINDPEFYLEGINHGVYRFILLPSSESYILITIQSILEDIEKNSETEDVYTMTVTHNNKEQTLSLYYDKMFYSMISLLENSLHQNFLLRKVLKQRQKFIVQCSNDNIIQDSDSCSMKEHEVEADLYKALENGEFVLHYQPVILLEDEKLVGFETLIRWDHPEKGMIPPDDFIPIVEATPLMIPLGYWIIEEVARQLKVWQKKHSFADSIRLNVNLSAQQFINQDLSDRIIKIMETSGINPNCIGLEITESAFMEDMEKANITLLKLQSKNFVVYMDDFGTGYSSLSYLQHFPVDVLKIDKSFVQWMHIDEHSEEIVRSIIGLAHNLKKKVVAEGVQEKEHMQLLKDLKCEYIQGFYISEPLPHDKAEHYLLEHFSKS